MTTLNERKLRRTAIALAVVLIAAVTPQLGQSRGPNARGKHVGDWRTFVVDSGGAIQVAPPDRHGAELDAELRTLENLQLARQSSPAIQSSIAKWDAQPAFAPWTQKALALIAASATSTGKAQRVMALVHVAMYDATVAAWHWKFE